MAGPAPLALRLRPRGGRRWGHRPVGCPAPAPRSPTHAPTLVDDLGDPLDVLALSVDDTLGRLRSAGLRRDNLIAALAKQQSPARALLADVLNPVIGRLVAERESRTGAITLVLKAA